jgi:hypothetical protein
MEKWALKKRLLGERAALAMFVGLATNGGSLYAVA